MLSSSLFHTVQAVKCIRNPYAVLLWVCDCLVNMEENLHVFEDDDRENAEYNHDCINYI